ncbi:ribonuclease P protein subunit p14-like [Branchiostoma floridae]|uniref:Ribonuclease P protein subunit p14-like n=2 Tax=Branchiostoma floridae TaxID=7739 RepID=A0A9J7L6W4_BRAFL|nr:ribonuclease P protein subunit p14-like [Branchiostoma floridae]
MKRIVSKGDAPYYYLKVLLEFEDKTMTVDVLTFRTVIMKAMMSMYGEIGAAVPIDILKYDVETMSAILRVAGSNMVKLWGALTMLSYYDEKPCAFRVEQVSPFLMALAASSRQLLLHTKE